MERRREIMCGALMKWEEDDAEQSTNQGRRRNDADQQWSLPEIRQ